MEMVMALVVVVNGEIILIISKILGLMAPVVYLTIMS